MITPDPEHTIGETFRRCVAAYGPRPFLAAPANPARAYHPQGFELSYAEAGAAVAQWRYSASPQPCCSPHAMPTPRHRQPPRPPNQP